MQEVVEAIVEATNLAMLIQEESLSKELRRTAEMTLVRLAKATDCLYYHSYSLGQCVHHLTECTRHNPEECRKCRQEVHRNG